LFPYSVYFIVSSFRSRLQNPVKQSAPKWEGRVLFRVQTGVDSLRKFSKWPLKDGQSKCHSKGVIKCNTPKAQRKIKTKYEQKQVIKYNTLVCLTGFCKSISIIDILYFILYLFFCICILFLIWFSFHHGFRFLS